MPNKKEHCRRSKERTGKTFEDLHEWMDGPQKELGVNHRTKRHDTSYIPEVKEKWGGTGVRELLRHIAEDYEYTAEQWGKDCVYCGKPTWKKNVLCNKCLKILDKAHKEKTG
jgi:hypothetical protein